MNLSEFLLARIAEDEEVAREATGRSSYEWSDNAFTEAAELAENEGAREVAMRHIARWDPARVLAECEAKRGLLRHLWVVGVGSHDRLDHCDRCMVIRYFGEVYADHPDYDETWRP